MSLLFVFAKTNVQISCAVTVQLISACCFRHTYSTISLFYNQKPSSVVVQPSLFLLDLVENPKDRFSNDAPQIVKQGMFYSLLVA